MSFIPTCSPDIEPLAVVVTVDPDDPHCMRMGGGVPSEQHSPLCSGTPTPTRGSLGGTRPLRHSDSDPKLPPKRERAGTGGYAAPERKRSRQEKYVQAGLVQHRGRPGKNRSNSSAQDSSSENTSVAGSLGPGEMPEVSEEEWQHRFEQRMKHIEQGKALPSYKLYLESVPRESRGPADPMTPNHEDRQVSKRAWKEQVIAWRIALRDRAGGAAGTPAGKEESVASEELGSAN